MPDSVATRNTVAIKPEMEKLGKLAWLLDSSIRIPGTSWRIGLDGLIGLVPGIGDVTAGALSSYILFKAIRMGVGTAVIARMVLNIMLESIVGVIPVLGDIFDFAFRANQRNVRLMQDYLDDPREVRQRSTLTVALVVIAVLAVLILTVWLVFALLGWIIRAV
ncbi:MAG: DUF4112 domain-containing protein [Thiolinea sp.]